MEEKKTSPILIPSTNELWEPSAEAEQQQRDSYMRGCLARGLENLRKFWDATENKPKKLLVASTKDIVALIILNEKSFQLMLNEAGLKGLTGERWQYQEVQLEKENTSVCPDTSKMEKPS